MLEVGCHVRIHELQSKPELNGMAGIVVAEVKEKGRWQVEVAAAKFSGKLKPSCLTLLATAADEAIASPLATTPPAVQHWLRGGHASTVYGRLQLRLAREAAEWLTSVVQNTHQSPQLLNAGSRLMACEQFTCNLGYLDCWDQILMPKLEATLVAHGETEKQANAACNLATKLTEAAILEITPFNTGLIPIASASGGAASATSGGSGSGSGSSSGSGSDEDAAATSARRPRADVRQDELMPSVTASVTSNQSTFTFTF